MKIVNASAEAELKVEKIVTIIATSVSQRVDSFRVTAYARYCDVFCLDDFVECVSKLIAALSGFGTASSNKPITISSLKCSNFPPNTSQLPCCAM